MKRVRFSEGNVEHSGVFENGMLLDDKGVSHRPEDVKWLPPVTPSKIIGLVLNYREHADELGLKAEENPVLFLKPNSSLVGHLGNIVYPSAATYVNYEGELAVVIGRKGRRINRSEAMEHVYGFTIANDLTARDFITNTFRPPVKAKGFDTFCPVGPWVSTRDEVGDGSDLAITTSVNGKVVQQGRTSMFMRSIPEVIEFVSEFMTLLPDDLILTGTPKGISPLHPGDKVDITIERIGTLSNSVVGEKP